MTIGPGPLRVVKIAGGTIGGMATGLSLLAFLSGYSTWEQVKGGIRGLREKESPSFHKLFGVPVASGAEMSFDEGDCVFPDARQFKAPPWVCSATHPGRPRAVVRAMDAPDGSDVEAVALGEVVNAIGELCEAYEVHLRTKTEMVDEVVSDQRIEQKLQRQIADRIQVSRTLAMRWPQDGDETKDDLRILTTLRIDLPSCQRVVAVSQDQSGTRTTTEGDCSSMAIIVALDAAGANVVESVRSPSHALWFMLAFSRDLDERLAAGAQR